LGLGSTGIFVGLMLIALVGAVLTIQRLPQVLVLSVPFRAPWPTEDYEAHKQHAPSRWIYWAHYRLPWAT
jgi:hypothetical protein